MANPSWSTNNSSFTSLPGDYMIGGEPKSYEEDTISLETGNGYEFNFLNFVRRTYDLTFQLTTTNLTSHKALSDYGQGRTPFYLSISGAGSSDSVLVTKEPGYNPRELRNTSQGIRWELRYRFREYLGGV